MSRCYNLEINEISKARSAIMEATILDFDETSFEETVIQGDGLVLVDFWAPWCGPCKQLEPVVRDIAAMFSDRLTVGKVNIDVTPSLAQKFGVRGIPSLLLFQKGELVGTQVGLVTKEKLREFVLQAAT